MILRSTGWDGPAPAPGDVVDWGEGCAVVTSVAAGAGVGLWRIDAEPARRIAWASDTGQIVQPGENRQRGQDTPTARFAAQVVH